MRVFVTLVPAAIDPKFKIFGLTCNGFSPSPKRETLCEMFELSVTVIKEVNSPAPVPSLATVGVITTMSVQLDPGPGAAANDPVQVLLAIENGALGPVIANVTAALLTLETVRV